MLFKTATGLLSSISLLASSPCVDKRKVTPQICSEVVDWSDVACQHIGCENHSPDSGIEALVKLNREFGQRSRYTGSHQFMIYASLGRLYFAKYMRGNPRDPKLLAQAGSSCSAARVAEVAAREAVARETGQQKAAVVPALCSIIESLANYTKARDERRDTAEDLKSLEKALASPDCGDSQSYLDWEEISLEACDQADWLYKNGSTLQKMRIESQKKLDKSLQQSEIDDYYAGAQSRFKECGDLRADTNENFHKKACRKDLYRDYVTLGHRIRDGLERFPSRRGANLEKALSVCETLQDLDEGEASADCYDQVSRSLHVVLGTIETSSDALENRLDDVLSFNRAIPRDRFPKQKARAETVAVELTDEITTILPWQAVEKLGVLCRESGSPYVCAHYRHKLATLEGDVQRAKGMVIGFSVATGVTLVASLGTLFGMYFPVRDDATQAAAAHRAVDMTSTIASGKLCADAPSNESADYDASCALFFRLRATSIGLGISSAVFAAALIGSVVKYKKVKKPVGFSVTASKGFWGLGVSGVF